MNEIRHATHWGSAQCSRRSEGICSECRAFLTDYQRRRRARIREQHLTKLCARLAAERQDGAA